MKNIDADGTIVDDDVIVDPITAAPTIVGIIDNCVVDADLVIGLVCIALVVGVCFDKNNNDFVDLIDDDDDDDDFIVDNNDLTDVADLIDVKYRDEE